MQSRRNVVYHHLARHSLSLSRIECIREKRRAGVTRSLEICRCDYKKALARVGIYNSMLIFFSETPSLRLSYSPALQGYEPLNFYLHG